MDLDYKTCTKCKVSKSVIANFYTRPTCKGRRPHSWCKSCARKVSGGKSTPKSKLKALLRKHNLTEEKYNAMLKAQNGKCKLCFSSQVLSIDHCHKSNVVRGILCRKCNMALGLLKDNIEVLTRAIQYLAD